MTAVPLLPASPVAFPDPAYALSSPDGLLAAGGDLTPQWLLAAYAQGIFPWFDCDDDHVLWWCPSVRAVIEPGAMTVRRSLDKRIRNAGFGVTLDTDFEQVIDACSAPRANAEGTWITPRMREAYVELHEAGYAHSVEVKNGAELVGGLYGVSLGRMFFGESMFARKPDASKIGFFHLQRQLRDWNFTLIDCQIMNPHLASLGVHEISRQVFLELIAANADEPTQPGRWSFDPA